MPASTCGGWRRTPRVWSQTAARPLPSFISIPRHFSHAGFRGFVMFHILNFYHFNIILIYYYFKYILILHTHNIILYKHRVYQALSDCGHRCTNNDVLNGVHGNINYHIIYITSLSRLCRHRCLQRSLQSPQCRRRHDDETDHSSDARSMYHVESAIAASNERCSPMPPPW